MARSEEDYDLVIGEGAVADGFDEGIVGMKAGETKEDVYKRQIKDRLEEFEIDGILDSGMLEQLTEEAWYSPFPQYQTTERPDRAAQELSLIHI